MLEAMLPLTFLWNVSEARVLDRTSDIFFEDVRSDIVLTCEAPFGLFQVLLE